jgi:hypothetical protein
VGLNWLKAQQYISYIMATSFSGEGSRREPPTTGKQLVNFITCCFRFIWPSAFSGDDFLEINQSETRIVYGEHVC